MNPGGNALAQISAPNVGLNSTKLTPDTRVVIVTPANGQQFAPGDRVPITVSIASPLSANDIEVDVPGIGSLPGTDYNGSTYRASFVIPTTSQVPSHLSRISRTPATFRSTGSLLKLQCGHALLH